MIPVLVNMILKKDDMRVKQRKGGDQKLLDLEIKCDNKYLFI